MTVLNPNDNFSGKRNADFRRYKFQKYGEKNVSNVKWTYNFSPIKKWSLIICSVCFFSSLVALLIQSTQQVEQKNQITVEIETIKRKYLEKKLEAVKQKTIAAEKLRIVTEEKKQMLAEPTKPRQYSGPKIYTWTNEHGQTVYSNKLKPE